MRDSYWDGIKGVAILAVIALHVSTAATSFPVESFNYKFGVVLRQFINWPVAVFFFTSGLFSEPKKPDYRRSRSVRILLPYVSWGAIYTAWGLIRGQTFEPLSFFDGTIIGVGYFVVVLLCLTLLSPLFWRMRSVSGLIMIFSAASLTFAYYFRLIDTASVWSRFPYSALPFFVWAPFYLIGIELRKKGIEPSRAGLVVSAIAVSLGIMLSLAEASYLGDNTGLAVSQIKGSSFFTSLAVIALIYNARPYLKLRSFAWLGLSSYAIYLSHMFVLSRLRGVLEGTALFEQQPIYFTASFTLVAATMVAMVAVARKLPIGLRHNLIGA
ncbi:acyltransferase [Qipengyuania sp. XHP0211]|uniref:acyltransferase family protein n=1 Tax=Qipengyuania sp. XHP0211 TaxID=3038079 RepID=UPI00241D268D|nr:acyltransferase [Qipengyuania sp. XHP0211]MDG5750509.1 acyltransferase [Qipengyuania sp. XHP0211]